MPDDKRIERGQALVEELSTIIEQLPDEDVARLLGTGSLDRLMNAILDPRTVGDYGTYANFYLANKYRGTVIGSLSMAITRNYAFAVEKGGTTGYVSPFHQQWFADGVMLLEGTEPFKGRIVHYNDGQLNYAIAGREISAGERVGPEDVEFITLEEVRERAAASSTDLPAQVNEPRARLKDLLHANVNDESKYQELLMDFPWAFGLKYRSIDRHTNLDDENVPDFTGLRVTSDDRDIMEVKPPLMPVFRKDGKFRAEFNEAWNQAERYLNFARQQRQYLRDKGLRFTSPRCHLIVGVGLSQRQRDKLAVKETMNPAIEIMTYDELLVFFEWTEESVRQAFAAGPGGRTN